MNWEKYRHNKRKMSKAEAQRRHYQASVASRTKDKIRRQAIVEAGKEAEKHQRIADAAAKVVREAQRTAMISALSTETLIDLAEIEALATHVGDIAAEQAAAQIKAALKKRKGKSHEV